MNQLSPEKIKLIEEIFDSHSYHINDDLDSLQYIAGSSVIVNKVDFTKAVAEILSKIKGSEWMSVDSDDKSNVRYPRQQTQPVPSKEVEEDVCEKSLAAIDKFLATMPNDKLLAIYEKVKGKFEGPTVGQYLNSTSFTKDTQDGKLNETFHNYGYPTDGGILGTEVSVKIDNQSNEETPSTTDIEKEAMELYPIKYEHSIGQRLINEEHKFKQQAHIKAYQMHRNDGLDQLIEWMEWESHRRWNESHELPDFTEILTKANEIKASLK